MLLVNHSILDSGLLGDDWRFPANRGVVSLHVTLKGVRLQPYRRQLCCPMKAESRVHRLCCSSLLDPQGRAHISPFSGEVPASLTASSLAEVAAPTLATVAGAPASGHTHCSLLATGRRSKPCVFVARLSWGQEPLWRPGCLVVTLPFWTPVLTSEVF